MNALDVLMPAHTKMKSWLEKLDTPVAAIGPVLHPEITIMQRRLLELFFEQEAYLAGKPPQFLEELLHRCEEQNNAADFSVRVSAEMNRTACVRLLEKQGVAVAKKGGKR